MSDIDDGKEIGSIRTGLLEYTGTCVFVTNKIFPKSFFITGEHIFKEGQVNIVWFYDNYEFSSIPYVSVMLPNGEENVCKIELVTVSNFYLVVNPDKNGKYPEKIVWMAMNNKL